MTTAVQTRWEEKRLNDSLERESEETTEMQRGDFLFLRVCLLQTYCAVPMLLDKVTRGSLSFIS